MSNTEEQLAALKDIRNMMERSSRFLSLNGFAGVFAGLIALAGALAAYLYADTQTGDKSYYDYALNENGDLNLPFLTFYFLDALCVLLFSLALSIWLTIRKARKQGLKIWNASGKRLLWSMAIPLLSGAAFCFILILHGSFGLLASATLVFYGLALIQASQFTFENVRILGFAEIAFGLLAGTFMPYGLMFWALGFGVAHMVYGIVMYYQVERNSAV